MIIILFFVTYTFYQSIPGLWSSSHPWEATCNTDCRDRKKERKKMLLIVLSKLCFYLPLHPEGHGIHAGSRLGRLWGLGIVTHQVDGVLHGLVVLGAWVTGVGSSA